MTRTDKRVKSKKTIPDKRQAIIDAVIQIVGEKGVPGITHRSVAKRAGVSLASTTYYFNSIDDIIENAFVYLMEEGTGVLRNMVEILKKNPTDNEAMFMKHMEELYGRNTMDKIKFIARMELFLENVRTKRYQRLIDKFGRTYDEFLSFLLKKEYRDPYNVFVVESLLLGLGMRSITGAPEGFWHEIFLPVVTKYFDLSGDER